MLTTVTVPTAIDSVNGFTIAFSLPKFQNLAGRTDKYIITLFIDEIVFIKGGNFFSAATALIDIIGNIGIDVVSF